MCLAKQPLTRILQERELIFKHLDATESNRLNKKFLEYTIDPKTRYLSLNYSTLQNQEILYVEEDQNGKRKSLAPQLATAVKKHRGNTMKDQESLILVWLKETINYDKKYTKLMDLPWKHGNIILDLIRTLRPDLIDSDTEKTLKTPTQKVFKITNEVSPQKYCSKF